MVATQERTSIPVLGLDVLRSTEGWDDAIVGLRQAWEQDREHAIRRAEEIRRGFTGQRGLMVLDVVLSRQRRYTTRVTPLLNGWLKRVHDSGGTPTLAFTAENPDSYRDLSLRTGESATIANTVRGLLRYSTENDFSDEDLACQAWARGTAGLELAPKLDPYIGAVKGIGPALFAYLRMLCGADTIKPDVRVLRQLRSFGLRIELADAAAGFVAAGAVAHELGIPVIELDQLLWYRSERQI